jgi:hypothetical protein
MVMTFGLSHEGKNLIEGFREQDAEENIWI